jgi:aspartate/methionine/tyrosine aminotransferase
VPTKTRPDIRTITRLVPPSGNLVQGQSELAINPALARAASEVIQQLNEMLISRAGVAGVPGSAFADSDMYDSHMRLCIAREDEILQGALDKIQGALLERLM